MRRIKEFFKKQWQNLLLLFFIALMLFPQIRFPIQVTLQRMFSFAPNFNTEETLKVNFEDWELMSYDGDLVNPSNQEKPIFINFWATWCPPCVAEMPSIQELYEDYGDTVNFVLVSNEQSSTVKNFLSRKEYSLPSYRMLNDKPKALEGNQLPTTYLVDASGKIIVKHVGAANWSADSFRKQLDRLIDQKP